MLTIFLKRSTYIVFFAFTSFIQACGRQTSVSDDFEYAVIQTINAFGDKNEHTLNKLIHKDVGLAVIFRNGVFDHYLLTDSINFNQPVPDYLPYPTIKKQVPALNYSDLPIFSCDSLQWNKHGLFSDTAQSDGKLLQTALNLIAYRGDTIEKQEIESMKALKNNSRRIILAADRDEELIFTLTLISGKWYLTGIDRAATDCSA
ncbi:hypothetical protein H8S90_22100 [Olivibacter sp. SDN3]|uniref:hypothetical protein n=1 Tax=Olivibacter sp. SDN3 TaxID=2764720 RepID=UPI001651081F|nr:hypothetical protein [Olivibacter sp. SDN3]QNL49389.1 hypothetical protein H8S90_22100 [Olivibacter sp. SDN3]